MSCSSRLLTATVLLAAPILAEASITIVDSGDVIGTSPLFGTTYFAAVTVQAGDLLVITHANNKRDNGTNTITASFTSGTNAFTAVRSGDSASQAGSAVFYSSITEAGTFAVVLDTSNASKTVSQSTSFYVLRAGSGETLSVSSTDFGAGALTGTLTLDFVVPSGVTAASGFLAASVNTGTIVGASSDWAIDQNGATKRQTFTDVSIPVGPHAFTFGSSNAPASDNLSAAGIVVTSIPEPATVAGLAGLAALAVARLRRRRA